MQNDTPITAKWSRSKPEVEFQYGGRLYFETGSSYISAVNWDISMKFGLLIDFDLLKAVTSTNKKQGLGKNGPGKNGPGKNGLGKNGPGDYLISSKIGKNGPFI